MCLLKDLFTWLWCYDECSLLLDYISGWWCWSMVWIWCWLLLAEETTATAMVICSLYFCYLTYLLHLGGCQRWWLVEMKFWCKIYNSVDIWGKWHYFSMISYLLLMNVWTWLCCYDECSLLVDYIAGWWCWYMVLSMVLAFGRWGDNSDGRCWYEVCSFASNLSDLLAISRRIPALLMSMMVASGRSMDSIVCFWWICEDDCAAMGNVIFFWRKRENNGAGIWFVQLSLLMVAEEKNAMVVLIWILLFASDLSGILTISGRMAVLVWSIMLVSGELRKPTFLEPLVLGSDI